MVHRTPICLVTGFLGSGKTTLLQHIVATHRHRRIVYLVNEFSAHDIDGAVISETGADVVSVPGGSIFCTCLVTEFIQQLRDIQRRFGDIQGVVIEASGMANPQTVHTLLANTHLDADYRVARIVTVVDPGSFHKLRHTLPGIAAQVATADLAIVNKVDCFAAETVERTVAAVRTIHERLEIVTACRCAVDFELFANRTAPDGRSPETADTPDTALGAAGPDRRYNTRSVALHTPLDPVVLKGRLEAVADLVYRLKGYVSWDSRLYRVDWTAGGFSAVAVDAVATTAGGPDTTVVVIFCGAPTTRLREFLAALRAGETGSAPNRPAR